MKTILIISTLFFAVNVSLAQLSVVGSTLQTESGEQIILRGANVGIAEDGNIDLSNVQQCRAYIDQIALTGANSLRFTWYTDGVSWRDGGQYVDGDPNPEARYHKGNGVVMRGYMENGNLSEIFNYCADLNIIPVLSIHDLTCANDWNYFNDDLSNWWKSPTVVSFIQEHQEYLIINLANEMGHVNYAGGGASEYQAFTESYSSLILDLRLLSVKVPIMIDAPDCGQSSSELIQMSDDLLASDPLGSTIFSSHAYWSSYAPSLAEINTKLDEIENSNKCFIFGEVANTQAGPPDYACGELEIAHIYPKVLEGACSRDIGWMAWVWNQDCDPSREMSNTSQFNNLTAWGNEVVNNANYGLKSTLGCGATLATLATNTIDDSDFVIYPNPTNDFVTIENLSVGNASLVVVDMTGREISNITVKDSKVELDVRNWLPGVYILKNEDSLFKMFVVQ